MIDAFDFHLLELPSPTTNLSFDVAVVAREVAETGFRDVDVVELRQRRGKIVTNGPTLAYGERGGGLSFVTQNRAIDELHHVKRAFVHGLIDTESEWGWNGNALGGAAR